MAGAWSGRERRIRLVLAVGALTAVATSAAEDFVRSDEATVDIDAGATARVVVRASETAHLSAEGFTIEFQAFTSYDVDATLRIVPDDERLPTRELRLTARQPVCEACAGAPSMDGDDDGGRTREEDAGDAGGPAVPRPGYEEATYDVEHAHCPERGGCELGFTLERSDGADAALRGRLTLHVQASARRAADPQFFCPDNRDFGRGASVEIEVDD
jgi:hypothetical protein